MAPDQARPSGAAQIAHEGGYVPAPVGIRADRVHGHDGQPLVPIVGSESGLAASEREKSDPASRQHVRDETLETVEAEDVKIALEELVVLCTKDLVVTRFHGMRKLSEEYASPTLGMLLEVGLRTPEAQATWNHLYRVRQSSAWKFAGVFIRTHKTPPNERSGQEALHRAECRISPGHAAWQQQKLFLCQVGPSCLVVLIKHLPACP